HPSLALGGAFVPCEGTKAPPSARAPAGARRRAAARAGRGEAGARRPGRMAPRVGMAGTAGGHRGQTTTAGPGAWADDDGARRGESPAGAVVVADERAEGPGGLLALVGDGLDGRGGGVRVEV